MISMTEYRVIWIKPDESLGDVRMTEPELLLLLAKPVDLTENRIIFVEEIKK